MRRYREFVTTCMSVVLVSALSLFLMGCDHSAEEPQSLEPAAPAMEDNANSRTTPEAVEPTPADPVVPPVDDGNSTAE